MATMLDPPDMTETQGVARRGRTTTIPSAAFLALFACIGTVSVAGRVFRRDER
ncbi:MAG: hypothetical protein WB797_13290 [Nocardioides sp.]